MVQLEYKNILCVLPISRALCFIQSIMFTTGYLVMPYSLKNLVFSNFFCLFVQDTIKYCKICVAVPAGWWACIFGTPP